MDSLPANLLVVPVVLPLITASLLLAVRWGIPKQIIFQRWAVAAALAINLAVSTLLLSATLSGSRMVLQMGGWVAPFGISFVADSLTTILLVLTGIISAAVFPYAIATTDRYREQMGFYPLYLFLLMGVNGAFLAGDLFNLYVFFEVLLMASFVLLTLGGQPAQTISGIRYVVLNMLASLVFLSTAGVAYGTLGTLNMAQIAERLMQPDIPQALPTLLGGLMLVAFGSKAAIFPVYFWLPSSYHTPPPAITALFGGLLTKVGVYTLFRSYTLFFPELLITWQPLIVTLAGFTMLLGVFGAMAQPSIRRVLSFHIISQVGYMIVGLSMAVDANRLTVGFGMAAGILYLVHHMIVKTALLMAGGMVEVDMGTGSLTNGKLGGLMTRRPVLAFLFFFAAMSLAGIPPSSGFVSKLSLLEITLDTAHWWLAGVSLLVSILTLMSMARLWQAAFWGKSTTPSVESSPLNTTRGRWLTLAPIGVLVAFSLSIGIFGQTFFGYADIAAQQILDREAYIAQVAPVEPPSMEEAIQDYLDARAAGELEEDGHGTHGSEEDSDSGH